MESSRKLLVHWIQERMFSSPFDGDHDSAVRFGAEALKSNFQHPQFADPTWNTNPGFGSSLHGADVPQMMSRLHAIEEAVQALSRVNASARAETIASAAASEVRILRSELTAVQRAVAELTDTVATLQSATKRALARPSSVSAIASAEDGLTGITMAAVLSLLARTFIPLVVMCAQGLGGFLTFFVATTVPFFVLVKRVSDTWGRLRRGTAEVSIHPATDTSSSQTRSRGADLSSRKRR